MPYSPGSTPAPVSSHSHLFPHLCFRVLIYQSPNIYVPTSLHRQPLVLWTAPRVHTVEMTVRVLRHKHTFPSSSRALHLLPDFVSRRFTNNTDYIIHSFTRLFDKCHIAWRVPLRGRVLAPRLSNLTSGNNSRLANSGSGIVSTRSLLPQVHPHTIPESQFHSYAHPTTTRISIKTLCASRVMILQ